LSTLCLPNLHNTGNGTKEYKRSLVPAEITRVVGWTIV